MPEDLPKLYPAQPPYERSLFKRYLRNVRRRVHDTSKTDASQGNPPAWRLPLPQMQESIHHELQLEIPRGENSRGRHEDANATLHALPGAFR